MFNANLNAEIQHTGCKVSGSLCQLSVLEVHCDMVQSPKAQLVSWWVPTITDQV